MMIEQKLTSMEVAEMVGKDHNKLLRDIRSYIEQLAESKIGQGDFFEESTYLDANNQSRPCYEITKKGCEFIAHKLTGVKGTAFTAKYINKFHEMEQELTAKKPLSALEQIRLQNQALIEVDEKVDNLASDLEQFKQEMPLLGVDMELLKKAVNARVVNALGGKHSNAYNNKSIRGKVYSDCWNELKRQCGFVASYKELKRNEVQKAIGFIDEYELPSCLLDAVTYANNQMRIEE